VPEDDPHAADDSRPGRMAEPAHRPIRGWRCASRAIPTGADVRQAVIVPLDVLTQAGGQPHAAALGPSILVVDDEESVRGVAARLLERLGYAVYVAASGHHALDLAEALGSVELLLTDVRMPGMTGPELVERLALQLPTVRVLYMSGYVDDHLVDACHHVGVRFLQKPFSGASLAAAVTSALETA
jgi:two-component system cell cycle sensor histidine kinase/response regulator CckA